MNLFDNLVTGSVTVHGDKADVSFKVPVRRRPTGPPPRAKADEATHNADFTCVNWYGTVYHFDPDQANVVGHYWTAWEQGEPGVTEAAVKLLATSPFKSLRDLFRGHPAWGSMLVTAFGEAPGTYRLNPRPF